MSGTIPCPRARITWPLLSGISLIAGVLALVPANGAAPTPAPPRLRSWDELELRKSLATQSLVIFVIRTRGLPWRTRPHPLLASLSIGVVAIGILIPLTPLGRLFGFVVPPPAFYLFLAVTVCAYLMLVEAVKRTCMARLTVPER